MKSRLRAVWDCKRRTDRGPKNEPTAGVNELAVRLDVVEVGGAGRFGVQAILGDLRRAQSWIGNPASGASPVVRPGEDLGGLNERHAGHGEKQHADRIGTWRANSRE